MNEEAKDHVWKVIRCGGSDQIDLRDGADLAALSSLDQKLWAALSCPVEGIRMDAATLALLDSDHDKRIRVPELVAAVEWMKARLSTMDGLFAGKESLPIAEINTNTPEGKAVKTTARRVLKDLGKPGAEEITLADIRDTAKIFAETPFNGDGILPASSVKEAKVASTVEKIAAVCGTALDRSGNPGVTKEATDSFFDLVVKRITWLKVKPALSLDDATAGAFTAVREKIDDFFTRCALAAFDDRATDTLRVGDAEYSKIALQSLSDGHSALAAFPISKVGAEAVLSLTDGINPYWKAMLNTVREKVFVSFQVKETLTEAEWKKICSALAPYFDWKAGEVGAALNLSLEALESMVQEKQAEAIEKLIAKDLAMAPEYEKIAEVEQMVLYYAHLVEILRNTVNMSRLYDPASSPLFRSGTLYIDGRSCSLCLPLAPGAVAAHSAASAGSKCCLVYCEIVRPGSPKQAICAPVTAGAAQTLTAGRNGVFYDLEGKDWDAKVVKLVEQPINLREAFWSPWRKIAGMIGGQVTKLIATKQASATGNVVTQTQNAVSAKPAAPAAAPAKMEGAALASSVAAIGIGVGLVGSAVGGLVSMVTALPLWKTLLGVLSVVMLVSLPSVVLAWFKLQARDFAPILNASGWAVNRRLGFSLKLGRLYTTCAKLPENAKRQLTDPYADRRVWPIVLWFLFLGVAAGCAIWWFFLRNGRC